MKGGLRLSGGEFRGRRLQVPAGARPTEARVREALFSRWQGRLRGSRFLDLFCGSGAVALEALGRGAAEALGVDSSALARAAFEANREELSPPLEPGGARFLRLHLPWRHGALAQRLGVPAPYFDLAFADPPYAFEGYEGLLENLGAVLDSEGEAAVEHRTHRRLPGRHGGLELKDRRSYGSSTLSFYRPRGEAPAA